MYILHTLYVYLLDFGYPIYYTVSIFIEKNQPNVVITSIILLREL